MQIGYSTKNVTPATATFKAEKVIGKNPESLNEFLANMAKMVTNTPSPTNALQKQSYSESVKKSEVKNSYSNWLASFVSAAIEADIYYCEIHSTNYRGGVKAITVVEHPTSKVKLPQEVLNDPTFGRHLHANIHNKGEILGDLHLEYEDLNKINNSFVDLAIKAGALFKDKGDSF